MTSALERLQRQIDDLVVGYRSDEIDSRPLMEQLRHLGPHLRTSAGVAGKVQPCSRPPGNLGAYQLYAWILNQSMAWCLTLGGNRVDWRRSLQLIPVLAQQRLDSGNTERQKILHGPTGLYAEVSKWHLRTRIFMGYDRPADRYPLAICPECHYQDERGGSIRARNDLAWCSNPDCRDDQKRRHEWNRIVLEDFIRASLILDDLIIRTAPQIRR